MTLKIGDTIYRFDRNRRVYDKPGFGGTPIYREHFEPLKIIGENKISWLLERGWKAKKNTLSSAASMQYGGRGFFTAEDMGDDIWRHDHLHKLREAIQQASPDQLRSIAKILEYKP